MTELPEGRKPLTTMDSADLVLRMRDMLTAGFSKGDRIAALEEMVEACKADAREAEAYAEELEAKLEKTMEALTKIAGHGYGLQGLLEDGASDSEIADYWMREVGRRQAIAKAILAELKGETDE